MTTAEAAADRGGLRRRLRAQRQDLPPVERAAAACTVARRLAGLDLLRPGRRVAVYLPINGELDTAPVIDLARSLGCEVFAPVITNFERRRMRFAALSPDADLPRNRWGIREPRGGPRIHGARLDLALVPCVGFDDAGRRIGLGAGFYDRHFAYLNWRLSWRRPRLVGLAFECQRVPQLLAEPWDVALWGVVTESHVYGRAARQLAAPGVEGSS